MVFTCVLYREIDGGVFGASSDGNLKGGVTPFDMQIEYKSSVAMSYTCIDCMQAHSLS